MDRQPAAEFCDQVGRHRGSFQRTFDRDRPDLSTLVPRVVEQITDARGRAQLGRVFWIDDPEDRREAIIKAACETFTLQMPGEAE